jgi:hypothetical protein
MGILLLVEQIGIGGQWCLDDSGKCLLERLPGLFVPHRLQGARLSTGVENPLDRLAIESPIPDGMLEGPVDVVALIRFLQAQDEPGMGTAVSWGLGHETVEKLLRSLAQTQEGLPDRLQAIAVPPTPTM